VVLLHGFIEDGEKETIAWSAAQMSLLLGTCTEYSVRRKVLPVGASVVSGPDDQRLS
jgi:hypothetical protein